MESSGVWKSDGADPGSRWSRYAGFSCNDVLKQTGQKISGVVHVEPWSYVCWRSHTTSPTCPFCPFSPGGPLNKQKNTKKRVPLWTRRPWWHHCIKMRWNCRLQRAALFAAECRFLVGLAVQHLPAAKTCKEVVLLCYVFQIESNPYKKLRTLMCFLL